MADEGTLESQGEENANLKLLREKAKRSDEMEAALAAMQRENAILKSGIDAEHPLGQLFLKGYDGDIADVPALTEAAKQIGIPFKGVSESAPAGEAQAPEEPLPPTGTEERQLLASGAPSDTGVDEDPQTVAMRIAMKAYNEDHIPQDEAMGLYINHLANAAQNGDRRAMVQENRRG